MRMRPKWLAAALLATLLAGCRTASSDLPGTGNLQPVPVQVPAAYEQAPVFGESRSLLAPPGYTVQVFAAGLSQPRLMAVGPDGALYVAEMGAGRISRLADANADGVADGIEHAISGLVSPNSVVWHNGDLYVGDRNGVTRFRQGKGAPARLVDHADVARGGHSTRTVAFGPDGHMYVALGSSCNVCQETDPRRAAVWVYDQDGGGGSLFVRGLRNSVGLAFHPQTGALWATDNGRDQLGDDVPPEEVNILQAGGDYGWPVCHGGDLVDPDLGKPNACQGKVAPAVKMQAHSAPLGITFWRGDAYVAFHGSWNRQEPTGYKVVRIPLTAEGQPQSQSGYEDFLVGFRAGRQTWGRPAGLTVGQDGALYLSDDANGVIYRITPPA